LAAELVNAGFKGLLIGAGLLQSASVAGWVEEFEGHRQAMDTGRPAHPPVSPGTR
ncbi:MAG: hypothetical protein QOD61_2194, partial [Solirubrobacteraceae bacterium]|nr:hypothetical protein [Solirubrobacteraceae bacterium]